MSTDKSAHATNSARIDKLTDENFSEWNLEVFGWALSNEFEAFIDLEITIELPVIPAKLLLHHTNRKKVAGFLLTHLDQANKVRFVTNENKTDPTALYRAICAHYQSNESANQARVFMSFLRVVFVNLTQFITDVRTGLVRMTNCDCADKIDDDFLAEIIVSKFGDELDTAKEILAEKRPLSTKVVLDCLDKHKADSEEKSMKLESVALAARTRSVEYCSDGKHNPKSTHEAADCFQLHPEKKPKSKKSKAAAAKKKAEAESNPTAATATSGGASSSHTCSCIKALACKVPLKIDLSPKSACPVHPSTPTVDILDSGSSDHLTADRQNFTSYQTMDSVVTLADGSVIKIVGVGDVMYHSKESKLLLRCFHVPTVEGTLISFGTLVNEGCQLSTT